MIAIATKPEKKEQQKQQVSMIYNMLKLVK